MQIKHECIWLNAKFTKGSNSSNLYVQISTKFLHSKLLFMWVCLQLRRQLLGAHNTCQVLVRNIGRAVQAMASSCLGMVEQGTIVIACLTTLHIWVLIYAYEHFRWLVAKVRGHEPAIILPCPPAWAIDLSRNHQHCLLSCFTHSTGDIMVAKPV